jgi:hypothetical protein
MTNLIHWNLSEYGVAILRTALYTYIYALDSVLNDEASRILAEAEEEGAIERITNIKQSAVSLLMALPRCDEFCSRCRLLANKCAADDCPANVEKTVKDFLDHTIMQKPVDPMR